MWPRKSMCKVDWQPWYNPISVETWSINQTLTAAFLLKCMSHTCTCMCGFKGKFILLIMALCFFLWAILCLLTVAFSYLICCVFRFRCLARSEAMRPASSLALSSCSSCLSLGSSTAAVTAAATSVAGPGRRKTHRAPPANDGPCSASSSSVQWWCCKYY